MTWSMRRLRIHLRVNLRAKGRGVAAKDNEPSFAQSDSRLDSIKYVKFGSKTVARHWRFAAVGSSQTKRNFETLDETLANRLSR